MIALDGTEYFSSKKINCPHCNCRNHRNGSKTYFHGCVIPAIVSPNMKQVIPLEPEFIKKQDGYDKEDCENAAVKRTYLSGTLTIFDADGLIIPTHIDRYDTITLQPGSDLAYARLIAASPQEVLRLLGDMDASGNLVVRTITVSSN